MSLDPATLKGSVLDIYIGGTGTGKSTCLSQRVNESVKTSSLAEACTQTAQLYQDKSCPDVMIMDTRGTGDADTFHSKTTDEQLLKPVFCSLQAHKISKVRIIWLISPTNRETKHHLTQAEFIASLSPSIWDAVVIISRLAGTSHDESFQGAWAAAKSHGCAGTTLEALKNRSRSLHILDLCEPKTDRDKKKHGRNLRDLKGLSAEERLDEDMCFLSDLEEIQCRLLKQATPSMVELRTDDKCSKCGWTGDSRGAPDYCHSQPFEGRAHRGDPVVIPAKLGEKLHRGGRVPASSRVQGTFWGGLIGNVGTLGLANLSGSFRDDVYGKTEQYQVWDCCGRASFGAPGCSEKREILEEEKKYFSECLCQPWFPPCTTKIICPACKTSWGSGSAKAQQKKCGKEHSFA